MLKLNWECISDMYLSHTLPGTLSSVTGSGHVKYMASPFFPFTCFVTVEIPCTSDMMTGHANTCQMIVICGDHLIYMTVDT